MPNIKSAKKRVLVSKVRNARNKANRTELKTVLKAARAEGATAEAKQTAVKKLDKAVARRLMDFLFGAIHVLGGTAKKVNRTTFVFAPGNVGVSGFGEEEEE